MGWTGIEDTPRDREAFIRDELTWTHEGKSAGVARMTRRGATIFALCYIDREGRPRDWYGAVALTRVRRGEFLWKIITDREGPCESGAPLWLVDALDEHAPADAGSTSAEWRSRVREYHKRRAVARRAT